MVPRSNLAYVIRFEKRALAALTAVLAVLLFGSGTAAAAAAEEPRDPAPVVVIGVGGLLWSDIDPSDTPALFQLVTESSLSSLTVRTTGEITCPDDGWLTLATGRRTLAGERGTNPVCPPTSTLDFSGDVPIVDAGYLEELNRSLGWRPSLGDFGSELNRAGRKTLAIGPGAALAAMRPDGASVEYFAQINDYLVGAGAGADNSEVDAAAVPDLLLVDAGNIAVPGFITAAESPAIQSPPPMDGPERVEKLREVDAQIGRLLDQILAQEPGARVLLFGPGATSATAHLTVLALKDPEFSGQWLRANSTRRDAVLTLTDLNPTLRELLDIEQAPDAIGAPAHSVGERESPPAAIEELATADAASHVIRDSLAPLMITLAALNLLALGAAFFLSRLPNPQRAAGWIWRGFGALAIAPLATFIGAGLPWTRIPLGLGTALGVMIGAAWAVLSAIVLLGPWRTHKLGPVAAAGLLTAVVLLGDSASGSHLQWVSPLGDTALVAGRFYGISNPPFTLAYTGALIGLAIISAPLARRFSGRVATTVIAGCGVVFTALIASPVAGANVGGTIAAVPGFIVLALLVSQVKITRSGIGFMVFGGIFVFTVFALIDFAQPPENRAHLGRFIARAAQGELAPMLWRKIEASFTIVSGNLLVTLIALILTGGLAVLIAFPDPGRFSPLARLYADFHLVRAGVISTLIGISIAVFTNDSGVALAFICLMILAPMLASAAVRNEFAPRRTSQATDVAVTRANSAG